MTTLTNAPSGGPQAEGVPPPPGRRPASRRSSSRWISGTVLIAAGLLLLVAQAGWLLTPWPALPAGLLALLGAGVVVEGLRGVWHGGLVTLGVTLTVVLGLFMTAAANLEGTGLGAGDRMYAPVTAAELRPAYGLAVGDLHLDLTQAPLPEGTTGVTAQVGAGELSVVVPSGTAVTVTADAGTGDITLMGGSRSGFDVGHRYVSPGYDDASRRLELDLRVGMGSIEVTR